MIYLNNAATSFPKPPEVLEKAKEFLEVPLVDTGRSLYSSIGHIEKWREEIAAFFSIRRPASLMFTPGGTYSLNFAINGFSYPPGSNVITTVFEHNSVLRPLFHLREKQNLEIRIAPCNHWGRVTEDALCSLIDDRTALVVLNHLSNVTGSVIAEPGLLNILRSHDIPFLLDCSQSAGSIPVDLSELDPDMAAFTGHKSLFGYPGSGLLYLSERVRLNPIIIGGTGVSSHELMQPQKRPLRFEAGTKNLFAIRTLTEGIRFLKKTGMATIQAKKARLIQYANARLRELKGIRICSAVTDNHGAILSFNVEGLSPYDLGRIMESSYRIIGRAGLHCVPLLQDYLNSADGSYRISFSYFNTMEDAEQLVRALETLCRSL